MTNVQELMVKGGGVLMDGLFCFSVICFLQVMCDAIIMVIGCFNYAWHWCCV
jgi:hypothetical protein